MKDKQQPVLSVSQVNVLAKDILESSFPGILVEGEISNLARPGSGHYYFSLKDEKSQLRCALFAGSRRRLRFELENGQKVVAKGKLSVFGTRGEMQLIVSTMEPAGEGDLRRQFEALKLKLDEAGWFSETLKKPLPAFCKHLAVVTSPSGAAVRDILHVLERRFPLMEVTIIPSLVQGKEASGQLCNALETANRLKASGNKRFEFDAILLARGGGSLEDLWPFNEENVARAVFESALPVISGVGHETDYTICDWVADYRAPTPSAAAEALSQDQDIILEDLEAFGIYFKQVMTRKLDENRKQLAYLSKLNKSPRQKLREQAQKLDYLEQSLAKHMAMEILEGKNRLEKLSGKVLTNNPENLLQLLETRYLALKNRLFNRVSVEKDKREKDLAYLAKQLNSLSPLRTLDRGYTISRLKTEKGLVMLSEQNPGFAGQTMITEHSGGTVESTITETNTKKSAK